MNGWVIIYLPGGDIYDMLDETLPPKSSFQKRLMRRGVKTFLAAAQLWWWMRKTT